MRPILFFFLLAGLSGPVSGQVPVSASATAPANYDDAKITPYVLPDPLRLPNGKLITTADQWEQNQRGHLLDLFRQYVYGQMPGAPTGMHYTIQRVDSLILAGKAVRKLVRIWLGAGEQVPYIDLILYLPSGKSRVPVFVALNYGNHTISPDSTIPLPAPVAGSPGSIPLARGSFARRWPLEQLIDAGVGLAKGYYADLEPDQPLGWQTGIRTTLATSLGVQPNQWAAIGAWAWGMSRIADYLETDPAVDAQRLMLQGHSRLGKAALWAGANDRRFALVVSNSSGEGGAALARRNYGETIGLITRKFPYWFIDRYATYADRIPELPVDQHELLALIAPRALYVTSAKDDNWADQRGEFLSLKAAAPVWNLYGKMPPLGIMPGIDQPVRAGKLGYHIRTGKHDVMPYDWTQYMAHARSVGLLK